MSTPVQPTTGLDAAGWRRIVQVLITIGIAGAIYFTSAGRLDLPWGWAYLGLAALSVLLGGLYVIRRNPQAINERGRAAEGQKGWDKIIIAFYTPLFIAVYIVAGLDARFGWSSLPVWLRLLGALLTAAGSALTPPWPTTPSFQCTCRSPKAAAIAWRPRDRTAMCAIRCT